MLLNTIINPQVFMDPHFHGHRENNQVNYIRFCFTQLSRGNNPSCLAISFYVKIAHQK